MLAHYEIPVNSAQVEELPTHIRLRFHAEKARAAAYTNSFYHCPPEFSATVSGREPIRCSTVGRCCNHKVKNHPVTAQPPEQSGSVILAKEPTLQANFARAIASLSKSQAKKVARFLPNPEPHWGPKVRAGQQITSKHVSLLGPQSINRCKSHEEGDVPADTKCPKMDDSAANS